MSGKSSTRHFYVDEAGDPTLFNAGGQVIVGTDGCSTHFILGALNVDRPQEFASEMSILHGLVLADPLYSGVESLRPERRKTHLQFHAKDDVPEVRDRVFRFLMTQPVRFYAVVRDKAGLATHVRHLNQRSRSYRYTQNTLYDEMTKRLFKNLLHKEDAYRITFATRGSKDRTLALKASLDDARAGFQKRWGIEATAPIEVVSIRSDESYCLQAADYFLWALMRTYTRGEDRFIRALWPRVAVVHDVDDRRVSPWGCYYNDRKPLTAEAVKKKPGI